MPGTMRATILVLLFSIAMGEAVEAAIVKVPKRYNVLDFYGGYSAPVGKYDGIGGLVDFRDRWGKPIDLKADDLYDPSFYFGFGYGQIRNKRMRLTIGFRFTRLDQVDLNTLSSDALRITAPSWFFDKKKPTMNQYDLDFNLDFVFLDIAEGPLAPYVGLGLRAGFTNMRLKGVASESRLNLALAANFGVELKVWESPKKRSFVTIGSVNNYEFLVSGDRARFFNAGLGVKYYFRP